MENGDELEELKATIQKLQPNFRVKFNLGTMDSPNQHLRITNATMLEFSVLAKALKEFGVKANLKYTQNGKNLLIIKLQDFNILTIPNFSEKLEARYNAIMVSKENSIRLQNI